MIAKFEDVNVENQTVEFDISYPNGDDRFFISIHNDDEFLAGTLLTKKDAKDLIDYLKKYLDNE